MANKNQVEIGDNKKDDGGDTSDTSLSTTTTTSATTTTVTAQNTTSVNVSGEGSEVIRLKEIASLYAKSGLQRRAAFYRRYAAIKAAQRKGVSDWEECYYLLIESLTGYRLTLDPLEYEKRVQERQIGWTGIHVQLLRDLTRSAIEMRCEQLAIRHLSFLLQCLSEVLTPKERVEFSGQLEFLGSRGSEGAPVNLNLENGYTIPSVNLTKFPLVTMIKIQDLYTSLRPMKIKASERDGLSAASIASPFIFTPIRMGSVFPRRKSLSSTLVQNLAFKWIQGESCQVTLQIANTLPIELQVNHISLVTDGLPFQTYPTSLTLPADSGPYQIQLTGTPLSSGKLEILGYSTHVLGVKSDCRWPNLPCSAKMELPQKFVVEVIPPLPLIAITTPGLPKSDTFSSIMTDANVVISNCSLSLYAGQSKDFIVKVTNHSPNNEPIESISLKLVTKLGKEVEKSLIKWDPEELSKNLPLQPHTSFEFTITVHGVSDFLLSSRQQTSSSKVGRNMPTGTLSPLPPRASSLTGSPHHHPEPSSAKRHHILGSALANFLSELQVGGGSNKSKYDILASSNLDEFQSQTLEANLEFEYTGGDGMAAGYCRKCAIALSIEILPSVLITRWDVLAAERPSHCYLVFDILNSTDNEVELKYHENKSILIEPRETCRIPVPAERCPLMVQEGDKLGASSRQNSLLTGCRRHLMDQVNLNWSLCSTDISGIASMARVPWSDDILESILMSAVRWDVIVDGLPFKPEEEFTYASGEKLQLSITLTNISGKSLKELKLSVQCFQDYQNGTKNYRTDMKRSIIGSDKVLIDEISTSASHHHELGMVFFFPGIYKIEIQCTGHNASSSPTNNHSDLLSKSLASSEPEKICNLVWKCSPTIEINVTA
ncbi:trafficking protein particle complex subunit brun [Brevipalpus obovatus]|uniref:trafficking protein particle complex subunit brun n=1 Tax=Brevipalpus obovatus TaxID=246614 RepID=UPI003D9ED8A3